MNNLPLVSVIMSAYNAEKFIEKSVKSVLDQTYQNIEFIICDDGSTDTTKDIVARFPSVKYFFQNNQGQGAGRNNAALQANGEYLAFIDADDSWAPEKIEIQVSIFKNNQELGAVYSDMKLIDEEGKLLGYNAKGRMKRGNIFNELIAGNYMCGLSSLMVKSDIFRQLGGFSNHRYCQDFVFLLRLASLYNVDFSERPLVNYLVHSGSVTENLDVSFPELISFYNEIPYLYKLSKEQKTLLQNQLKKLYFSYALLHFRKKNFIKTTQILREAKASGKLISKSKVLSLLNLPVIRTFAFKLV